MRGDTIRDFKEKKDFYRDLFLIAKRYHPAFPGSFENHFTITLNKHKLYQFYITGCQGSQNNKQRSVAHLLNSSINQQSLANNFGLFLGDNFYPAGVTKKNDDKFRTQFSDMYSQNIFWFAALGNHDWNMQHWFQVWIQSRSNPEISKLQRAMFQVEHTYLANDKWLMPFSYYVINTPYANLFILDSNTFFWDHLQQDWLIERYQHLNKAHKINPKKNIIAMHHPLQTIGKRHASGGHSDIAHYILPEYRKLPPLSPEYSQSALNQLLLTKFIEIKNMTLWTEINIPFKIDHCIGAHDHFLAHYNITSMPETKQLISGGGGGILQNIYVEPELRSERRQYKKAHGYLHLKITQEKCAFKFHQLEN